VLATTAKADSSAGAYPITVSAGTLFAPNYDFPSADLKNATLTITPAPLTITALSTSGYASQPLPAFSVVYSGFVHGDTPASLAVAPSITTTATTASLPGAYPITPGGASSPNYQITYVPATLTLVLAPATVESVSLGKIRLNKRKTVEGIVLRFSEALDAATAQSISSYSLATVAKTTKQKSQPVALSTATYNSTAFTVTLLTKKPLAVNPPLLLTVAASSVLDALGRELDGDDSGQPGSNFTAVLSGKRTQITSAVRLARLTAAHVD
jgi:MBG domain (YGX type)